MRGALVKRLGELLPEHKADLADLISVEVGKIRSEALGEVQEMIDICDFAVGLSRQLDGRTMPSERPGHRLMETWHPLGVVGVISAFNFPAAVWSWNTAIALVCGDTVVWKPSEQDAADRAGSALARSRRAAAARRPTSTSSRPTPPRGTALVDSPAVAAGHGHRLRADGRARRPRVAARFGRVAPRARRQQRRGRRPSADLDLATAASSSPPPAPPASAAPRCAA